MSPRPEGTPMDRLRFVNGGGDDSGVRYECGWKGPWPPPARLLLITGRATGYTVIADPADVTEAKMAAVRDVADVEEFVLGAASELPDDDDSNFLMRGARYSPLTQTP